MIRARMLDAARAKARCGELRIGVPIGYIWHREYGLGLDPDLRLQQAIRLVFERFRLLGSARQTHLSLVAEGLVFPRPSDGKRLTAIDWRPLRYRPNSLLQRNQPARESLLRRRLRLRQKRVAGFGTDLAGLNNGPALGGVAHGLDRREQVVDLPPGHDSAAFGGALDHQCQDAELECAVMRCGIQWNIGRTSNPVVFIRRKQDSMIHMPL